MSKAMAVLICAVLLHNVQMGGVVAVCSNEYEALSLVSPCIEDGSVKKSPDELCCKGIKKLSLGCFCSILISASALQLVHQYVGACNIHVPPAFKCESSP
ncbi:hypothetical protein SUGI_0578860 [Cryptomeria japonica]|nr:hypothetical protein SUGI_0578860 [Cryptomeria japonica]